MWKEEGIISPAEDVRGCMGATELDLEEWAVIHLREKAGRAFQVQRTVRAKEAWGSTVYSGTVTPGDLGGTDPTNSACYYTTNVHKSGALHPLHAGKLRRFSRVWLFATLWTVAHQVPQYMGFSRQEYWSGLPHSGDLPDTRIEPASACVSYVGRFFTCHVLYPLSHVGSPLHVLTHSLMMTLQGRYYNFQSMNEETGAWKVICSRPQS